MTLRRRWFVARDRFHVWMWGGGPVRKAIIKRLPMHFSDPHYIRAAEFERLVAATSPMTLTVGPGWTTSAAGGTFHLQLAGGGSTPPVVYVNGVRQPPPEVNGE